MENSTVGRDYFYAENYYDYAVQLRSADDDDNRTGVTAFTPAHLHWNSLTRLALVTLLRVGFVLVQIGSVPINNVNLILLQNVIDLCCVTVAYLSIGFTVAYNGDLAGLIGEGRWIGDSTIDVNEAIVGWQAVAIASAIHTAAVAGRTHTVAHLLTSALLSGLTQPLLLHWAWTAEGWMRDAALAGRRVAFKDYAGAGVVHVVGGLSGLIGCLALGRRLLRLKELDDASIAVGSGGLAFGGLLLILIGLQSLCTSVQDGARELERGPSHAYVNNLLAASSCSLLVVALHFALGRRETFDHWTVMRCARGTIAGVVAVSAAANDYSPQIAVCLGCFGGVAFYLVSRRVFRSALEDYCDVVAVHLGCAVFASVLAPICAMRPDEDTATILLNFSWQLICLVALSALVGVTMLLIYGTLECCDTLRNRWECLNHVRANAAAERRGTPSSFPRRLFSPDNFACLYLQPSSLFSGAERRSNAVGSTFWKYRTEMDRLEEGRPTVTSPNQSVEIDENATKIQAPETRLKKARQVHTLLSGRVPMPTEGQGGTGESINDSAKIGMKVCLARQVKCVLEPIKEIDEEDTKEFRVEEKSGNIENYDAENFNRELAKLKDSNESNYRLRRTVKLMNLYREFIQEDVEVVLEPKHIDSSSSDSYDEDSTFTKRSDSNESMKDIVTGGNWLQISPHVN